MMSDSFSLPFQTCVNHRSKSLDLAGGQGPLREYFASWVKILTVNLPPDLPQKAVDLLQILQLSV